MRKLFLSELRLYICNHVISHTPSHRVRLLYYRKIMGFNIGKGSYIFMNCRFDCAKGLSIGENSVINANCRIDTRGGIAIGSNVSISEDVILLTADHDELFNVVGRNKKIIIDDFVWIGTRALILPGTQINKGGVVASGAVVTRDVEKFSVVAGVPARFLKSRPEKFDYKASYKRFFQ